MIIKISLGRHVFLDDIFSGTVILVMSVVLNVINSRLLFQRLSAVVFNVLKGL